ncbi:pseudouridine synthase [Eggerthia catenaformis OT 569 = DSM 20559]|uniref:Pseudouridine synthase n=1 Tax=Eggerthia catenaformis OT 569 = DSM 20559 TaxID=999415 RepID=M2P942_9FIRM|nr:pseudouridine synthase [Eggerthia catenaformis]EMD16877.1 pseudouridine synthase [Eggerthia catenaformis OT 569 = DSM 20559]OUC51588.1 hypothetical protein B7939_05205 [Eggerthia catenaformis]
MKISEILILNHLGTKKQVRKLIRNGQISSLKEIIREDREAIEQIFYLDRKLDMKPLKYYLINKPLGYLCSHKSKEKCLIDLLPDYHLHYVGRLDRATCGLMIMTNDKKLRKKLMLPEFKITRTYYFECLYELSDGDVNRLNYGVIIDKNVMTYPESLTLYTRKKGTLILREGKYHEIRKIFLSLNNQITYLKRIEYGDILLEDLKEGKYRELHKDEIKHLYDLVNH